MSRVQHVAPIRPESHEVGRPTVRKTDGRWAVTWVTPVHFGGYLAWTSRCASWSRAIETAVATPRLVAHRDAS